jgi:hypothetical protein
MRILSSRSCLPALAALVALAPIAARSATSYSRRITVRSGLFLGLHRDQPQRGTVKVTRNGQELGRLTFAGSFVELRDKGTYDLEFSPESFDLNFAIVRTRESTGAYMLNLARSADHALKARGAWMGDPEGRVTVHEDERQTLIVVD